MSRLARNSSSSSTLSCIKVKDSSLIFRISTLGCLQTWRLEWGSKPTFGVSARPPEQENIRMLAWGDLRSSSMMRMRRGRKRCASIISASASCQLSIFFATLRHRRRWHVRGRHVRGRHIWESLSFTHNSTGLALFNRLALKALEYIEVL